MQPFEQLEKAWAEFNQLDPAGMVACSSGTAALHLALEALQLPPGGQVIVPDFTMVACARAVVLAGLEPVFVDCDERLLMPQELLHQASLLESKVVMAVHVYGRRQDMDRLTRYAALQNWLVVEDLAEAHGVRPHPDTDAACWSFYKNKIVAGEEGGAVWFRDPAHATLARQLRCLGFTEAHDFRHVPRGHNYRMSNLHAEHILGSLRRNHSALHFYEQNVKERREIESWYDEFCSAEWRMPARDAVWVYDVRIPGLTRPKQQEVVQALNQAGIAARMGFLPMTQQPEFSACRRVHQSPGPSRATVAAEEVFYLPVQPGVTTRADCERSFHLIRDLIAS